MYDIVYDPGTRTYHARHSGLRPHVELHAEAWVYVTIASYARAREVARMMGSTKAENSPSRS